MNAQRPKIAVLADWWWPETVGGAERSARAAAMELARFATVEVFVPATEEKVYPDGPLTVHAVRRPFGRRAHADSKVRRGLEFLTAWLWPPIAGPLGRRLRAFGPDVVVATNVSRTGPWLVRRARALRKATGARFVRVYHDLSDTCWRRSRLKGGTSCAQACGECSVKTRIMRAAQPADGLAVCVSGFVQTELVAARLTTPARSLVAYPMLGARGAAPTPPHRPAGDLVTGYIGRLDAVKGIESAIRAAAAYRRGTGKAVSMLVAGEGHPDYVRSLAELARAEGLDLELAGHLDVDAFCARVDVVLIPSKWMEPFGRVAVEVGRRGLPMLISPVGGLPEAAAVSGGRFGFADFEDPEAAARSLAALLDGAVADVPAARSAPPIEEGVALAVRHSLDARAGAGR
ncbi:glycosyltransferase [Dactylosporangium sp. AC04546]|uniref:glycosyltransferase n=1 Tax=Dactylosporangium sp. AC04546 TaxID=2862460 RepID=UPI001EDF1F39|nr:glycosyltransferase [Dactylosporangium sp. AC04546]WVK81424.1 glycosyltransferase [Dactylosporangium sp. AC04546]